jgi:zinc transport system substrate-binding protein
MPWVMPWVLMLGMLPAAATAEPRVIASIAPIHSLVAGVTEGITSARLLVPGGRSPHTFSLRPSDTRALARADAVFAAGETTERFLERPLASLAADAAVVRMIEADGVRRLPARAGGAWSEHHHHGSDGPGDGDDHDHGPDDGHDHEGHAQEASGHDGHDGHEPDGDEEASEPHVGTSLDPHVWLDPHNAIAFTRAVAETLARIDPANAEAFAANARRQIEHLEALDRALARELEAVAERPYLVFHDAYQYFEARYELAAAGSITVDPGRPPGARRLAELRERIRQEDIQCLFVEPQFEPEVAHTIAEGTGARVAELDPLGAGLKPGPELYERLLRQLAENLRGCLGQGAS